MHIINSFLKRFFDLIISFICILVLFPIWILVPVAILIDSKGAPYFLQRRLTKNGRVFRMVKFRTMVINAERIGTGLFNYDGDTRITRVGKFLRKTSLDELPQLINIVAGQMSVIGPRPVTKEETELYNIHKDYVLSVLPGLSGMWQISGRSDSSYDERIQYDIYYIQNWSIWLDIWILIKTVYVVLKGRGAY